MNKFYEQLAALEISKTLIVALAIAGFYWYALYDDGSALEAQLASVQAQVQEEEKKKADTDATLRQVKEMQEKIGQLSEKYQEISRRLPATLYSIDINKAIDDFARTSGVSVKSKTPGETIKKELAEEVPVKISLEGTYAELAQFTFQVSSAERIARVVDIDVSLIEGGGKELKFEGNVIGYKLAPEPPKPATSPDGQQPPPPPGEGM